MKDIEISLGWNGCIEGNEEIILKLMFRFIKLKM